MGKSSDERRNSDSSPGLYRDMYFSRGELENAEWVIGQISALGSPVKELEFLRLTLFQARHQAATRLASRN